MFTTLYSEGLERPVTWTELATAHRAGRASPEAYFEFCKIFPIRGDAVDPAIVAEAMTTDFTRYDPSYERGRDSTEWRTALNAENNWHMRSGCPPLLQVAVKEGRAWASRLDSKLATQYINILKRGLDARDIETIGGLPHVHRYVDKGANEGIFSIAANFAKPEAMSAVGAKLHDAGLRVAALNGTTYLQAKDMRDEIVELSHANDVAGLWRLARNYETGWHVIEPNRWYMVADIWPHFANTLSPAQQAMARELQKDPRTLDEQILTFNLENFYRPLPVPETPEMKKQRDAAFAKLFPNVYSR